MRRPYSGNLPITSEFGNRQFWLNGKLITDFHSGIDIGGVFDVLAAEGGTVIAAFRGGRVDSNPDANTPANYIKIDHGNGVQTYYWHLSSVDVNVGQQVSKGQKIGVSGRTGYATGNHLHFSVYVNGQARNPRDYVNFSTDSDNTLPVNNNNMGNEFQTVGDGWGLSNVASAAGLPINEDTYRQIYNLNPGHRGSWDWQSLNARMGAGDVLRVRSASTPAPTPVPIPDTSNEKLKELQTQIDKLNAEKAAAEKAAKEKYEALVTLTAEQKAEQLAEVAKLKEEKRKEAEALSAQLQKITDEYQELEKTSIKLNVDGFSDQVAAAVTTAVVEELKAKGIKEKWAGWVDAHFSSNFVRQLLKYTWPAWIFFFIAAAVAWAAIFKSDGSTLGNVLAGIVPLITVFGAAGIQFLLTNYDKNKDGKVDFNDFVDELSQK